MARTASLLAASTAVTMIVLVAGAIAAPTLDVPKTASIGDPLTISAADGLTPRLFYRATFTERAARRVPGRQCARNIDRGFRVGTSPARVYVFHGRVPQTLACVQDSRRFTIPTTPGSYTVVVGHKTGKAAWDAGAVTLRRSIEITR
jgi:hypothetical protein